MRFRGESTALALALFSYVPLATSQHYSPPADQTYAIETGLQSLLQDTTISQEKELSETLAWYQKLPSEGSCVQLAAMKLMSECKLLDNPSEFAKAHPDLYLDDVKVEYAVKLANCEIVGARPDQPYAPQHCEVFVPSAEACTKRSWTLWGRTQQQQSPLQHLPCYPQATDNDLHRCLKTLRSSPQYWTSFSNAKFRAVNMCQLSRHAIERQKTLQLHKNLTLITYRVQTALHGVQSDFQAFHAEIKQSTNDIKHSTDQFRQFSEEAREEAQQEREQVKREMHTVQVELAAVHDAVVSSISTYNAQFDDAINATMAKVITAVTNGQSDALSSISAELESFYRVLKEDGSQLAAVMNEEIQQHHEKALLALQIEHGALMQSYAVMSDSLDDVSHKVDDVHEKIDVLDNKTDKSLAKIVILDDRLDGLGTKFKAVERAFVVLQVLFSLGTICLIGIAIVFGVCVVCMTGRAFQSSIWYFPALVAAGVLVYVFNTHSFFKFEFDFDFDKIRAPKDYLTIEPPSSFISYIQASPVRFWSILAASCFLLAALLPKINSFCEESRDRTAALPAAIYRRIQSFIRSNAKATPSPRLPSRYITSYRGDDTSTQPKSHISLRVSTAHEDQALNARLESFQRAQSVA